jgi:hypothetical protein
MGGGLRYSSVRPRGAKNGPRQTRQKAKVCDGHHRFLAADLLTVAIRRQLARGAQGDLMKKARDGMLILLLSLVATAAVAKDELRGTPEQRAACMGDALMLCSDAIPNRARIASCLGSKLPQLSPRCRAQFQAAAR